MGDGLKVRVWKDSWIWNKEGMGLVSVCPAGLEDQLVLELLTSDGKWNDDLIDNIFNQRDANLIKMIPLSCFAKKDYVFWKLFPSGAYSVKTTYQLGLEYINSIAEIPWQMFVESECSSKNQVFLSADFISYSPY